MRGALRHCRSTLRRRRYRDRHAWAAADGLNLISAFREDGHLHAKLDPLNRCRGPIANSPKWFSKKDSGRLVSALSRIVEKNSSRRGSLVFVGQELREVSSSPWWKREALVKFLQDAYTGTIGFEMEHLQCSSQRNWWHRAAEQPREHWGLGPMQQRLLLLHLLRISEFTRNVRSKYPSAKFFSISGCEALLPGLFRLCRQSAHHGVQTIELGMTHRGRMAILANLLGKPLGMIFSEMRENRSEYHVGDVKYHLGFSGTLPAWDEMLGSMFDAAPPEGQGNVKAPLLRICPNPSHLEVVSPVVIGKVRAEQDLLGGGDQARSRVMGVVIHGDAAFAISGISYETMQMSELDAYTTGGTVHVVLNNQIGFTTNPSDGHSSPHPSDVAKAVGIPVVHVNADDVEAVDRAFKLAADWRAQFKRDVVVDLVGYRREGHNQSDDPETTHPKSYSVVKSHPEVSAVYQQHLSELGVVTQATADAIRSGIAAQLEAEYSVRSQYKKSGMDWVEKKANRWNPKEMHATGIPLETLCSIGHALCQVPEDFALHPLVAKLLQKRTGMLQPEGRVDFGMAELLALGSITLHRDIWSPTGGIGSWEVSPHETLPHKNVRLIGQDSERGTFNQRYAVIHDFFGSDRWSLIKNMAPGNQARFAVHNSPLSELSALAFEYGYSIGDPESLVCWEAQFGDFANCAQVIIDQFIASGEEKWGLKSSLTMLLPHGYEGQGPDHSSARVERFLQLVNDDSNFLPGNAPAQIMDIDRKFDVLDVSGDGILQTSEVLKHLEFEDDLKSVRFSGVKDLWTTVTQKTGVYRPGEITRAEWRRIMQSLYRATAEQDANIFVLSVSTPANYFHALRRQAHSPLKVPVIILTPKYALHHAHATSSIEDLCSDTHFRRVIVDYNPFGPKEAGLGDNTRHRAVTKRGVPVTEPLEAIRRVIMCSGQIYYTLSNARRARKIKDITILRIEQLAPFPYDLITETIAFYPNAEVIWCQEEPKNMGAWEFVQPRLAVAFREVFRAGGRDVQVKYVGRPVAAATATGSYFIHKQEMQQIVNAALR